MKNACVLKTHMILSGFHCNVVHKKVLNIRVLNLQKID